MSRISDITDRLDKGEGSAGRFLHDPSLYDNTNKLLTDTQELIKAVRQNPKKYLTIRSENFLGPLRISRTNWQDMDVRASGPLAEPISRSGLLSLQQINWLRTSWTRKYPANAGYFFRTSSNIA